MEAVNEPKIMAAQGRRGMEERLWSTLGAAGVARWTRNLDGSFHDPQPSWSKLTGQTQGELASFGWLAAVHPDDRDRVRSYWAQGAKGPVLGYRLRDATGTWREVEERTALFDGSDGLPPQALGIIEERRWRSAPSTAATPAGLGWGEDGDLGHRPFNWKDGMLGPVQIELRQISRCGIHLRGLGGLGASSYTTTLASRI